MLRKLGINKSSWGKWRRCADIPVWVLVTICNYFNLTVGNFIKSSEDAIPDRDDDYDVCEEKQRFMPSLLGTYTNVVLRMGVREVCQILGMSVGKFYTHYRGDAPTPILKVREFVEHCNRLKVCPGAFITNADIENVSGYASMDFTSPESAVLLARIAELERMVKELITCP